ncbi:synembryn [Loa loa]|uniref:Synembryn n=1 Tax=Loa loa TaxID=7209 RepID=A0A1I7VGE6_LOALO|nr:synembryn [Loa loa]EFO26882.1 synembryn [Loa loa]
MADDISESDLVQWQNSSTDDFVKCLKRINDSFEQYHTFSNVDVDSRRRIQAVFRERFQESSTIRQQILRFLRILARDKQNLDQLLSSGLVQDVLGVGLLTERLFEFDWESFIQAEMCLINILFNSKLARDEFNEIASDLLLSRIRLLSETSRSSSKQRNNDDIRATEKDIGISAKPKIFESLVEFLNNEQIDLVAFYDLRIAFVASAQSKDLQLYWLKDGCEVFLKILEQSLHFPERLKQNSRWRSFAEHTNWALKILFNIFCYSRDDSVESNAKQCMLLCSKIVTLENIDPSLEQSAVDVIAVFPLSFELLTPKIQHTEKKDTNVIHGGRDMTFANAVLHALERRLEAENNEKNELLGTFLTVLIRLSSQVKEARRYLRLLVIPPLHATDVERRPDDGIELRNRMIRLMMSISNIQDLAAEFIFILCKKSVNRFVKYCGFGHAAGLLANRGILNALNTPKHHSDSEASETEDYKAVETQVNPVTGCIDPAVENPFTGMTEEQKEYEVHRLMNDINKLMNQGLITPGQIGKDGHLEPVKHVLELVKDDDTEPDRSDSEDGVGS